MACFDDVDPQSTTDGRGNAEEEEEMMLQTRRLQCLQVCERVFIYDVNPEGVSTIAKCVSRAKREKRTSV